MLKALRIVILLFVMAPTVAVAQTPPLAASRLAYFSPQRAFASSVDGKAAQAKLFSLEAQKKKVIDARTAKLKGLQDALRQSESVLGEAALRQRQLEVERFEVDVRRFVEDAQAEFLGVQRTFENAFLAKLRPALAVLAKERGLLLVLNEDAGVVAWADTSLDLTADLVKRVDTP